MSADLTALLDAFAQSAPRNATLYLPAPADAADALLHWSIERGYGAETKEVERNGERWRWVTVTLPSHAYVSAHREGERIEQEVACG